MALALHSVMVLLLPSLNTRERFPVGLTSLDFHAETGEKQGI
jgi:hypothetical protein